MPPSTTWFQFGRTVELRSAFANVGSSRTAGVAPIRIHLQQIARNEAVFDFGADARPVHDGNRVRYRQLGSPTQPTLDEWWEPRAGGLEHGVTVQSRPHGNGALRLRFRVRGAQAEVVGERARFLVAGQERYRYDGLLAYDAAGRHLPASMVSDADGFALVVDDRDATYPIVVDPLVWDSSALSVDGLAACDGTGGAIALAAQRELLAVGSPTACVNDEDGGAVMVLERAGEGWAQRGLLTGPPGFASSLAVAADAVYVGNATGEVIERFVRLGPRLLLQTSLTPPGDAPRAEGVSSEFGVSMAADPQSVAVGAPGLGELSAAGIVYVFRPSGDRWLPLQSLTEEMPAMGARFGQQVAMGGALLAVASDAALSVYRRATPESRFILVERLALSSITSLAVAGDMILVGRLTPEVAVFQVMLDAISRVDTVALGAGTGALSADGSRFVVDAGTELGTYLHTMGAFASEGNVDGAPPSVRALQLVGTQVVTLDADGELDVFRRVATLGSLCASASECQSGFCVDGVCCESLCGGQDSDCQACSAAAGSSTDGRCEIAVAGTECRGAVGACDQAEVCDGESELCPGDVLASAGQPCREVAGPCDVEDRCSGASPFCPRDRVAVVGTLCRPASGDCDVEESCDGLRPICPADRFLPRNTTCRVAAGPCDVAEQCVGTDARCPSDAFQPFGFVCRDASGDCDAAERCTGSGSSCPRDELAEDGTACQDGDACTLGDMCVAGRCQSGTMMCEPPPDIEDPPAEEPPAEGGCTASATHLPLRGAWLLLVLVLMRRRRSP